jgi:hypothetical protein
LNSIWSAEVVRTVDHQDELETRMVRTREISNNYKRLNIIVSLASWNAKRAHTVNAGSFWEKQITQIGNRVFLSDDGGVHHHGIILSTEIKYTLFPKLKYPDNI